MNRTIAMILSAAMLAIGLSGCAAQKPAPSENMTLPAQSEPAQPESSAEAQTPEEQPPEEALVELAELTEFVSDYGYTMLYEATRFDDRQTAGYDEFILLTEDEDKPYVFVAVSRIEAEYIDEVKGSALGDSPEACAIGPAQMQAQCSQTTEAWDGGEIIHKNYICPLDDGEALLIETQWYTEQGEDSYETELWDMVNSITV